MVDVENKGQRPTTFLVVEFLIIVLGVLVALAVDSWNTSRSDDEVRAHLIASLLTDLQEDQGDYAEFVASSVKRAQAARVISRTANGEPVAPGDQNMTINEALHLIARSSRLETVDITFREMTARGTGTTIEDTVLRLRISHYYGLANDRADINDLILPAMLRYRAYLEEVGMSYVDAANLDPDVILSQPKVLAVVRELGTWAEVAAALTEELQIENQELIDELNAFST